MGEVYWGSGTPWKTEAAFLSWIRGGIRRSLWNRHPQKLNFIKNNRIQIPNPNPKGRVATVWGGVCALTGEVVPLKDLEVDHIEGNHSLRCVADIQQFVEGIVLITEDDLQFVSKEAHKAKSYAEKNGISFEEALIEKKAIDICKKKVDKMFIQEHNEVPATNASKRRKQVVEILRKEMK